MVVVTCDHVDSSTPHGVTPRLPKVPNEKNQLNEVTCGTKHSGTNTCGTKHSVNEFPLLLSFTHKVWHEAHSLFVCSSRYHRHGDDHGPGHADDRRHGAADEQPDAVEPADGHDCGWTTAGTATSSGGGSGGAVEHSCSARSWRRTTSAVPHGEGHEEDCLLREHGRVRELGVRLRDRHRGPEQRTGGAHAAVEELRGQHLRSRRSQLRGAEAVEDAVPDDRHVDGRRGSRHSQVSSS